MSRVESAVAVMIALAFGAGCAAGTDRSDDIAGAWRVVGVSFGTDSAGGMVAQPGQFIFTRTRYSAVWVTQSEPRMPSARHFEPTPEEVDRHYRSVAANSGSYEIAGSRLTIRPVVAKLPDFAGGYLTYEFELRGDTLLLQAVDERSAAGVVPTDYDSTRERLTLIRIE